MLVNTLIAELPKAAAPGIIESTLTVPDTVTLPWLWKNVSVPYWWASAGLLFALVGGAFSLGVKSRIPWVEALLGEKISSASAHTPAQTCGDAHDAIAGSAGVIRHLIPAENLKGEFSASGMTTVNRKCVSLWLAIQNGDTFWPRTEGPVAIDERGNWSQTVTERGDPAKLALSLWASNASADERLRDELKTARKMQFNNNDLLRLGMKQLDTLALSRVPQ